MTLYGLDMQGRITDWPRAKALGKLYAITRCVGENGAVDPDYAANAKGAAAAGLIPGGYHFIAHGTSAEHCKVFVDAMGDPTGKLVMLDVENPNYHPDPTADDVYAWLREYRRHQPTHPVIVYTRENFWASLRIPTLVDPYAVFMTSRYPSQTSIAYPGDTGGGWDDLLSGRKPLFWQYTGSRNLGLGAAVDLSAFHGTLADLRNLASDLPDTGADTDMVQINVTDPTPKLVDLAIGIQLYSLANPPVPSVPVASGGTGVYSPALAGNYRVVVISIGGVKQLGLVQADDCKNVRALTTADCSAIQAQLNIAKETIATEPTRTLAAVKTAVAAAIIEDRAKAHVVVSYE